MRGHPTRFIGLLISCLMLAACSGGQLPITPALQSAAHGLTSAQTAHATGGALTPAAVDPAGRLPCQPKTADPVFVCL
jgi:hypothetical protein